MKLSNTVNRDMPRHEIFISHSAKDAVLAGELSRLIESGLLITSDKIFCSSLPGQGIMAGQPIVDTLWNKISISGIVLFIITESFINSAYCMCELGAVWGAQKAHIPILVPPLSFNDLPGVLGISQALNINDDRDLDNIRDAIASKLPHLTRKRGFAKWNDTKNRFNKEVVRIISQYSPDRTKGQDLVSNMKLSLEVLAKELRLSNRHTDPTLSWFVVVFDIDKLTQINKTYQYHTGNLILKETLEILNGVSDFVEKGRCGDDTFFGVIFGEEANVQKKAVNFINIASVKLNAVVKETYRYDVNIKISGGIANIAKCATPSYFYYAFAACESAKGKGGGRIAVSDHITTSIWS